MMVTSPDDHHDGAVNVMIIPSVSGGLGHVTRTLKLARGLERADPSLRVIYGLDEVGLRPINQEAISRSGFPLRVIPNPVRHERDERIRATLGDIDVVIEDTNRRLVAHRPLLPRLRAWISLPMLPIWDDLHMDWPLLEHVDCILYAYPAVIPVPEELDRFRDKLTVTGPILDPEEMPGRAEARHRLGLDQSARYIIYAPRGFPFGQWFGRRVLSGVVGGYARLARTQPDVQLLLTAVPDLAAVQPPRLPPLDQIDGVSVWGTLSPEQGRDSVAAADLVIVEGTTTLFDAATAGTPVLMVPGLIYETALEGTLVDEHGAGIVMRPEEVTARTMATNMRRALDPALSGQRVERLRTLVGPGGRDAAVSAICRVIEERVRLAR